MSLGPLNLYLLDLLLMLLLNLVLFDLWHPHLMLLHCWFIHNHCQRLYVKSELLVRLLNPFLERMTPADLMKTLHTDFLGPSGVVLYLKSGDKIVLFTKKLGKF